MRDLKQSNENELIIEDAISGSQITLFYRLPTTKERIDYQRAILGTQKGARKKTAVIQVGNIVKARLLFGLEIFTGFKKGDFGYDGKLISSNPEDADYREDWKALVEETASDLVIHLGLRIFENTNLPSDDEIEFEEETEDSVPLSQNSGNSGINATTTGDENAPEAQETPKNS